MHPLIAKMYEFINLKDSEARIYAENRFTELLTFSSFDDLIELLDEADRNINYPVPGLPVWARILAYRLAYLQKPKDLVFLRRASLGLRLYGPDWDLEADRLEAEANRIESFAER